MMTLTHVLVGAISTGLALQTSSPVPLLVGSIASIFPDVDISTSPAGRILPFISRPLEKRFSHRSATHSLLASFTLATITYGLWFASGGLVPLTSVHAFNVGYFAGWFLDCFTKSGVEMFYPSGVKCVFPGNRNLRIATGSPAEYWLIGLVAAIAIWVFQLNNTGGLGTNFNSWIGAPSGVVELYNDNGGSNIIYGQYSGVWADSRVEVKESSPIIAIKDTGFLVEREGKVLKVGDDLASNIVLQRITGKMGPLAITKNEQLYLDEESTQILEPFVRDWVYVSGSVKVDTPEDLRLEQTQQFQPISLSGSTVNLDHAPIAEAITVLSEQFLTGSLTIKEINVQAN